MGEPSTSYDRACMLYVLSRLLSYHHLSVEFFLKLLEEVTVDGQSPDGELHVPRDGGGRLKARNEHQ